MTDILFAQCLKVLSMCSAAYKERSLLLTHSLLFKLYSLLDHVFHFIRRQCPNNKVPCLHVERTDTHTTAATLRQFDTHKLTLHSQTQSSGLVLTCLQWNVLLYLEELAFLLVNVCSTSWVFISPQVSNIGLAYLSFLLEFVIWYTFTAWRGLGLAQQAPAPFNI